MAKRSKKKKPLLFISIILFLACAGGVGYWWYRSHASNFVTYPEFGIEIPENFSVHGIDVSHHQDNINWNLVRNMQVKDIKVSFAFIKATEGVSKVDSRFNRNWFGARSAGVTRGAYHFFLAKKSGKLQAQNFIDVVDLESGDLPPVLDVEQLYGVNPVKLRKEVKEFLRTVHDYYGIRPIIYTNADFYTQYLKSEFDEYPLWVAHYLQRDKPRIVRNWMMWQHSESGRVDGIRAKVDFNVFNGDSTEFLKLLID
ncbi:MAG: glycoside hydrolase family 25 protein [Gemmatimonadaceae bacterium]|nr:glycoside hydrolase family 25 protein [Chitinophagaceae bacterium]